jgi:hypothetical protein
MKRPSLTTWILIALIAGIIFGAFLPGPAKQLAILGTIFLKLIKSIIAPLLFATLVVGIAGTGNVKTMGRIGGKAILYFEIVTTIALVVGLLAVNIVQPGVGVHLEPAKEAVTKPPPTTVASILEHTFPASIIDAMAKGDPGRGEHIFRRPDLGCVKCLLLSRRVDRQQKSAKRLAELIGRLMKFTNRFGRVRCAIAELRHRFTNLFGPDRLSRHAFGNLLEPRQ